MYASIFLDLIFADLTANFEVFANLEVLDFLLSFVFYPDLNHFLFDRESLKLDLADLSFSLEFLSGIFCVILILLHKYFFSYTGNDRVWFYNCITSFWLLYS